MTKLRWSKEEYTELLNFVKDNYSSVEWELIMNLSISKGRWTYISIE
tara:strand:- start:378 stop:518 length:141 start_codon:yes stop_codon:yes gene_type:complete